jgi:hypothetical protein
MLTEGKHLAEEQCKINGFTMREWNFVQHDMAFHWMLGLIMVPVYKSSRNGHLGGLHADRTAEGLNRAECAHG